MKLDDEQIERYSRQLILAEVGPHGQARLGAARVAVAGTGVAAEHVVAYLAAAGVGWIAADERLHRVVDPAQSDLTLSSLTPPGPPDADAVDALVVVGSLADIAELGGAARGAAATFWIAGGYASGVPPCAGCAAAALVARPVPSELAAVRDLVLGTIVATEVLKTLVGAGVPFAGRALAYDPTTATVGDAEVPVRRDCASCAAR